MPNAFGIEHVVEKAMPVNSRENRDRRNRSIGAGTGGATVGAAVGTRKGARLTPISISRTGRGIERTLVGATHGAAGAVGGAVLGTAAGVVGHERHLARKHSVGKATKHGPSCPCAQCKAKYGKVAKGADADAAKLLKDGLKFKPVTPKAMTGPGSMRHKMDPSTSHRADAARRDVGKSAAVGALKAGRKIHGGTYRITDAKKPKMSRSDKREVAGIAGGSLALTGAVSEGSRRAYNRRGANVAAGQQLRHPVATARTYRAIDRGDVTKNAFGVSKSTVGDVTTGLRRGLAGGAGQFGGKGAKVLNATQAVGRTANKTGATVAANKAPIVAGAIAGAAVTTTATTVAKKPPAQGAGW